MANSEEKFYISTKNKDKENISKEFEKRQNLFQEEARENKKVLKEIKQQKADLGLLVSPEVQEKIAKDFEKMVALGITVPAVFSLGACAKPPVIEVNQETTSTTIVETSPPTTEETVPPTTEEITETTVEIKEFDASMIKKRFIFFEGNTAPNEELGIIPGGLVPLWQISEKIDLNGDQSVKVSGIIAGELKRGIGESGKEEILLPIAFQNPETMEFEIVDLSFGSDEYFNTRERIIGWGLVLLDPEKNERLNGPDILHSNRKFEEIKKNIEVGNQIAFFLYTHGKQYPLDELSDDQKFILKYIDDYCLKANQAFVEAMIKKEKLPDVKITTFGVQMIKVEEI